MEIIPFMYVFVHVLDADCTVLYVKLRLICIIFYKREQIIVA